MITVVNARRQAERATTQQDAAGVRTEEDYVPPPAADAHSLPADLDQLVELSKVSTMLYDECSNGRLDSQANGLAALDGGYSRAALLSTLACLVNDSLLSHA